MSANERLPIYTADNEPFMDNSALHAFDLAIWESLNVRESTEKRVFDYRITPVQRAATELIPQGIDIAQGIRELVRQAHLYSASILLRPLVERTATIHYLVVNPQALDTWQAGTGPEFRDLAELLIPDAADIEQGLTRKIWLELIASDLRGIFFNMFAAGNQSLTFASGKPYGQLEKATSICILATHCLQRLATITSHLFSRND